MFRVSLCVLVYILVNLADHVIGQTTPKLELPQERTTGLGCIPEGRTVSYQCTVSDTTSPPIGVTAWVGSAFLCPSSSNRIILPHSLFSELVTATCGDLRAAAVGVSGNSYVSELSFIAFTELNRTTLSCSLSGLTEIGSDILTIGVIPPPPKTLAVILSSRSSLNVSWSPPSGPVEGGVGGYVFDVTGEGCGCVSMNVSGDTTSVTCSGWTAAGQTCSFEVRTLSQDCGFASRPVNIDFTMIATCDPAELGGNYTSVNSFGRATISNGVTVYNGVIVGSTAYLLCDEDFIPSVNSSNRTCMSDGLWSGSLQNCVSTTVSASPEEMRYLAILILLLFLIPIFVIGFVAGYTDTLSKHLENGKWLGTIALSLLTLGGFIFGTIIRRMTLQNTSDTQPETYSSEAPLMPASTEREEEKDNEIMLKRFKKEKEAPMRMSRPIDAAAHNGFAYFRPYRKRNIFMYNSKAKEKWLELPECLIHDTSLVILPHCSGCKSEFTLHTVCGYSYEEGYVSYIYCLKNKRGEYFWDKDNPSFKMNEIRKQVTAICHEDKGTGMDYLIVTGGRGPKGLSKTTEVLNLCSGGMSLVAKLPKPVFRASGCVNKGSLYILGGCIHDQDSNQIDVRYTFKASLDKLIKSKVNDTDVFQDIADLCLLRPACTAFCGHIYAIGGSKYDSKAREAKCSDLIYIYDPKIDSWKKTETTLNTKRCLSFAVSIAMPSKPLLMVVGGYTSKPDEQCSKSVEITEKDVQPTETERDITSVV